MHHEKLGLPARPSEPRPEECCGRNCERCVYVYYEEALQRWKEAVESLQTKCELNPKAKA